MTQASPRVADLDMEAAEGLLAELDLEVEKYVGELDYRYAAAYASRGHMRFAAGGSAESVLDDFWMASRCLAANPGMHLIRHAPEQLLTRRIMPVELGLLGGQIDLAKRLAAVYGLPLVIGRAGLADAQLEAELRTLSPGLLGEPLRHPQHLLGLAAAVYAGCLGSAVRGFEDEVRMGLGLLSGAIFDGELTAAQHGTMARYGGLCTALLELTQPGERHLEAILADQIERYAAQTRAAHGQGYARPTAPRRYMDTSSMAILALARLAGYPLGAFPPDPSATPNAARYQDFLDAMAQQREQPAEGVAGQGLAVGGEEGEEEP